MHGGCVEFVDQDAIDDGLPHLVVVLGFGFDILRVSAKCFAALALGDVLAIVNLSPKWLPEHERANPPNSNPLSSSELAASWARSLSTVASFLYSLGGYLLASMPNSFVLSPQKTQIKAIRLFRVYASSNAQAITEKCLIFRFFEAHGRCGVPLLERKYVDN